MCGLVACSEAVTMLLILGQQAVIDDHCSGFGGDELGTPFVRVKNRDPIRVVEHGHTQMQATVGKILEVLCHTKVPGNKPINVNLGWFLNCIRVEVFDETLADTIDLSAAENGQVVCVGLECRLIHRQVLALPLFQFLDKAQPLSFTSIEITGSTESRCNVVSPDDILW